MNFLYVFIGGGLGSIIRYAISLLLKKSNYTFPLATLIANIAACLILGYFIGMLAKGNLSESQKLLLMTGFCGGFSTFSTFSAETLTLFESGNIAYGIGNIILSVSICIICIIIGNSLAG